MMEYNNNNSYQHVHNRTSLSDDPDLLHINDLPPPYSEISRQSYSQSIENDWRHEFIEIRSLHDNPNRYGFAIGGGIDNEHGPWIIITQIDYCQDSSLDNGRTKLRLFDRILSINGLDLTRTSQERVAEILRLTKGQTVLLHIYRLNPLNIEHITIHLPTNQSYQSLGIIITGGLDKNKDDPGIFINAIDEKGLLASVPKSGQFRKGDRILEIRTSYSSVNLELVTESKAAQLIRRICADANRITFIVNHRT